MRTRSLWRIITVLLGALLTSLPATAQFKPIKLDDSDVFFNRREVPRLKIVIPEENVNKLRNAPREYVTCTIIENGQQTYTNVGIKLKGAAGSFRPFDDRPALTLNTDKFNPKQKFHDLDKFHLNNSVQDPSYLNEMLCAELFHQAGVPTPRVTHARVWLNNRDMGVYVLKEGWDKHFLHRWFKNPDGNFYEGGFVQDIDGALTKESGNGPNDRSDLAAIVAAVREPDPIKRWAKLAAVVDIPAFLTFMAVERMTCHWDGYTLNRNNYRIYFNPATKKAVFLPHGMDQMFGDTGMPIFPPPGSMVGSTVMQNPAWRKLYRERVEALMPLFTPPTRLGSRADEVQRRLEAVWMEVDSNQARAHKDRVKELKERLVARVTNLRQQADQAELERLPFDDKGIARLTEWAEFSDTADTVLKTTTVDGKNTYTLTAGLSGKAMASFRTEVILKPGRYVFKASCRTAGVLPLDGDKTGGVAIRSSKAPRTSGVVGTVPSKPLEYSFVVREDRQLVVLLLELRAKKGSVTFDGDSLTLTYLGQ